MPLFIWTSQVVLVEDECSQFVACRGDHLNEEQRLDAGGQSQKDPEENAIDELRNESPLGVVPFQIETCDFLTFFPTDLEVTPLNRFRRKMAQSMWVHARTRAFWG